MSARLLWVDLEMTGLDPVQDRILEVAAIATDFDLEPLAEYTAVVRVDEDLMRRRMTGEFWEKNAAAREGLMAQNALGRPVGEVEAELMEFVRENFDADGPVYLAGNSVHQDRKFIEREMPALNRMLHYRMMDVSAWKLYFENALGRKFEKGEAHRALDDIRESLGELKYYLSFVKKEV